MKKFKKAKIITALCSAITIIGTTLFLVSCSDTAGSDAAELPSNPQERQTLLNNVVQNIINEVIQEDNNNYQNVEEKNKVNKEAQEIAKEIFNGEKIWGEITSKPYQFVQPKEIDGWNNRYGPVILETAENILQIPGLEEAWNKPFDFNDVAKERFKTAITAAKLKAREEFTQQVKQEAKKIVQNENNKAEAQQKAQESGVEEAKKFLENKIKQEINENINRYSDWSQHHWNKKILDLATADTNWSLFIVKNSSAKHYIEEIEKIFQKKEELREAFVTYYKYATLGALDKSKSITNEKVRTKAKKIVTKVFENKTFQTVFVEDGLLRFLHAMDLYSSYKVREGIEKLNLI